MAIQHQEERRIDSESPPLSGLSGSDEEELSEKNELAPSAHTAATIALCLCMLTHSWLLISVYPYSGFMAIDLIPEVNEENAGSYAGMIASSFMIGRALSSYGWGKLADIYGRKFVLFASLGLSCLFSLLFGMAPTFGTALVWRFMLGLGNGIIGTAKTTTSEIAYGNQKLETRGMGIVMGMWGWGFLFSPALSGFLAEPVRQYPKLGIVQSFHGFLSSFPFLIPNLVSVLFCSAAFSAIWAFVPETLPIEKLRGARYIPLDAWSWLLETLYLIMPSKEGALQKELKPMSSYGTISRGDSNDTTDDDGSTYNKDSVRDVVQRNHRESVPMLATARPRDSKLLGDTIPASDNSTVKDATMASLWSHRKTRNHLLVYWIYSFVSIQVNEVFPLFCLSREAGLGLSEGTIGKILSGSGLIFACCQYFVYAWMVNRYGLQRSIQIGAILSGPIIALIPIALLLNRDSVDNSLTWSAYAFLSILLAANRVFGLVFFSSITILTNRTVIASHRGSMNGLSMLGGSFAKGMGPLFSGFLFAFSVSSGVFQPHVGAVVVFAVIGLVGCLPAAMTFTLLRDDGEDREIELSV